MFDEKVAVITGGTQGLGESIALLFAERGIKGVAITGRNQERGKRVVEKLSQLGAEAIFIPVDLSKIDSCRKVMETVHNRFGRVDHLVNVAGCTKRGTIVNTTPDLFDEMFAVNIKAPFFLIQDATRIMIEQGIEGSMVNILSTCIHCGQPFLSAYSASKAALANLTKNTAFALLKNRIRINGLAIGWMDTPGEHSIQKEAHNAADDWLEKAESIQPFGRLLKTEEVAKAVFFLCSPESGMVTGSLVDFDQTINGGWEVHPFPASKMTLA